MVAVGGTTTSTVTDLLPNVVPTPVPEFGVASADFPAEMTRMWWCMDALLIKRGESDAQSEADKLEALWQSRLEMPMETLR